MNIATYLLEKNRKLHKKIDLHGYPDYCENVILEPSRFRSLKSPTVVLTGTCENSAGRNSVERYCLATGFKVRKVVRGHGLSAAIKLGTPGQFATRLQTDLQPVKQSLCLAPDQKMILPKKGCK